MRALTLSRPFGHDRALDGLRGVAVILVVLYHLPGALPSLGYGLLPGGWSGVTLFFCLSGFLITETLLAERRRTGSVSLRAFYLRRFARLGPALIAFMAVLTAVSAAGALRVDPVNGATDMSASWAQWAAAWAAMLTLTTNWWVALDPAALPFQSQHLWSLAIEEQFYLVWPTALLWLAGRGARRWRSWAAGRALAVSGVLLAATVGVWALLPEHSAEQVTHFSLWANLPALLGGCAVSLALSGRSARVPSALRLVLPVLPAVLCLGWTPFGTEVARGTLFTVVCLAWLALVAGGATGAGRSWLSHPALGWFGTRSYALYLWHFLMIPLVASQVSQDPWAVRVLSVLASMAAAELSWRLVEVPVKRWILSRADGLTPPPGAGRPGAALPFLAWHGTRGGWSPSAPTARPGRWRPTRRR